MKAYENLSHGVHFTYISFGTVKLLRSVHSLKNLTNNGLVLPGQRTTTLRISLHLSLLKDQNPRDQKKSQIISTSGKATLSIYNIYNRNIKRLVLPIRIVKSNVSSVIGGDPIHQNSPKCKGGTPLTKIHQSAKGGPYSPKFTKVQRGDPIHQNSKILSEISMFPFRFYFQYQY